MKSSGWISGVVRDKKFMVEGKTFRKCQYSRLCCAASICNSFSHFGWSSHIGCTLEALACSQSGKNNGELQVGAQEGRAPACNPTSDAAPRNAVGATRKSPPLPCVVTRRRELRPSPRRRRERRSDLGELGVQPRRRLLGPALGAGGRMSKTMPGALSGEVGTGSPPESATNQKPGAPLRSNRSEQRSSPAGGCAHSNSG